MKVLFFLNNIIIRFLTGIIPSRKLRRYLRNNFILEQLCPRDNKLYYVSESKKCRSLFIKKGVSLEIYGRNNTIEIDNSASCEHAHLVIRGNNNKFHIGKKLTAISTKFYLYGNNSSIIIGDDCMFSYDVELWSGDGHAIFENNSNEPKNYGKDIIIGNHVWLGAHSRILKGSTIPDGSIVGMASIVNKQYSMKNIILAGHPAKIVKQNCHWYREEPEYFIQNKKEI